jgi:nucleotidyltransferase/DNA polymerase involved in DNA repair
MCSNEAAQKHIYKGMKLSEAKAVLNNLIEREYNPNLYSQIQNQLLSTFINCSPKIANHELGVFLLDASGLTYLGGEEKFCQHAKQVAFQAGFKHINIAIADTFFAALTASKLKNKEPNLISHQQDKAFLAPLPIQHLPLSFDIQESLQHLGIKTIGQFANLSKEELQERFGKHIILTHELANGIDKRYLCLPIFNKEFKCIVDIGSAIQLLNEAQFVIKAMLDRLAKSLKEQRLLANELQIVFYNDNDQFNKRPIKLLRPTNNSKFLLEIIKLSLAAQPLTREFTQVEISISQYSEEEWQQSKIDKQNSESPKEFDSNVLLIQKFMTRLGENALSYPIACDQYIPEHKAKWQPVIAKSNSNVLPINTTYSNEYVPTHTNTNNVVSGLALRKLTPPTPVFIEIQGSTIKRLLYNKQWYIVKELTIPERLSGLWWNQQIKKSYYMALLENNTLALLVHDHVNKCWQLEGFFD